MPLATYLRNNIEEVYFKISLQFHNNEVHSLVPDTTVLIKSGTYL